MPAKKLTGHEKRLPPPVHVTRDIDNWGQGMSWSPWLFLELTVKNFGLERFPFFVG
jgi:hypothetical protein